MKTLILITGYARAGKDTLAEGIILGSKRLVCHVNFADSLKQSCDCFMQVLQLGGSGSSKTFRNEAFKIKHRDFLVAAGMFARSIDRDVFALAFSRECKRIAAMHDEPNLTVVASDWRYMNELTIPRIMLGDDWNILTVQIATAGVQAANEEEGKSIGDIVRNTPFHLSFGFNPDNKQAIITEGKNLARKIGT